MRIVGVDPGKTGGIAVLSAPMWDVSEAIEMPEVHSLRDFFEKLKSLGKCHVFLEKAQVMYLRGGAKPGAVPSFNYGKHFGNIEGILVAYRIPHTMVQPNAWTRVLHRGTKDGPPKARSLEAVRRIFPGESLLRPGSKRALKPHDGIVDALAIAEYGRRVYLGQADALTADDDEGEEEPF